MEKAINDQIAYEASWCEITGYDGSAAFFFEQAIEENTHMLKFVHYLNNAEAEAIIPTTYRNSNPSIHLQYIYQYERE